MKQPRRRAESLTTAQERTLIAAFEKSKLSPKEFCKRNKLKIGTFYNMRRRVADTLTPSTSAFLELPTSEEEKISLKVNGNHLEFSLALLPEVLLALKGGEQR